MSKDQALTTSYYGAQSELRGFQEAMFASKCENSQGPDKDGNKINLLANYNYIIAFLIACGET